MPDTEETAGSNPSDFDLNNSAVAENLANSAGTKSSGTLPLIIAEGIRYNCQGCGRCCGGWSVGLSEGDFANVKDTDWGALHPELSGKELFLDRRKEFQEGRAEYPYYTAPKPDGTCSFLINGLCFIHGTLGEDLKPNICKIFPYTFVPTPTGIYVGALQNSMAAVRNMGNLLSDQKPYLEKMWKVAVKHESSGRGAQDITEVASNVTLEDLKKIDYKVSLVKDVPMSWEDYLLLEECMLSILNGNQYSNFFESLLAISELLNEAVQIRASRGDYAKLKQFKPADLQKWKQEEPTFFEVRVFNILCYRNFVWPQLRKQYAALWTEHNKSPFTEKKVISTAVKTTMFGKMELAEIGSVDVDKARKMKTAALQPEVVDFLKRQIYVKVFSKSYFGAKLVGLSVQAGFNNLVGNVLSAVAYAKAHALHRGSNEILIKDLYEAVFLLDKENVALSQLPQNRSSFYD
ncbi:MAG TPA: hypothetical protein V6C72_11690, partial [Chroococcales cyanobacterium]